MNVAIHNLPQNQNITNHNDIVQIVNAVNTIATTINDPWNQHDAILNHIDYMVDQYQLYDWNNEEWTDFIDYVNQNVPEYNNSNFIYFSIYMNDVWLFTHLNQQPSTISMLYFSAGMIYQDTYGPCFNLFLNHLIDANLITPNIIYTLFFECSSTVNHAVIDDTLRNNRIRSIIDYQNIPQFVFQQMIQNSNTGFYSILEIFDHCGIVIPNDYNLIPYIITYTRHNDQYTNDTDSMIHMIQSLIRRGHLYDRNTCLQYARMRPDRDDFYDTLERML
jgi:hypothetical protein